MATGIVSVAMHSVGWEAISVALLVITAAAWTQFGAVFFGRLRLARARWWREAQRPTALTAVAGTAVLGSRLVQAGWAWAGWALLVVATLLCLLLIGSLARVRSPRRALAPRYTGAVFLVVVAPESLAVLAASLGMRLDLEWPGLVALPAFGLGLAAYPIVLARFDVAQLRDGAGDQWVSGGSLAISTLACAEIVQVLAASRNLAGLHDALRLTSVVLWGLAVAWIPLLVAADMRWPRMGYDVRRWATVFPLGMYSVMTVTTGHAAGVHAFLSLGDVLAWVSLAAWATVSVGWVRSRLV